MFGTGSGSFFTSGSTFGGGQPSTNIFGTSTSGGTGLLSMGNSANRGIGIGGGTGIFGNSSSSATGSTGIFGVGASSTGVFGGGSGGIFGSSNTGGASTPIFGGGVNNSAVTFGGSNQGPSFAVFAQNSPFFQGTQQDRFVLKKNKDEFDVICYTFMEKYNGIPLKMLRLQDYANFKEGRILDDHKQSINKYFQTVKNTKSGTFTTGGTGIGSSSLFTGSAGSGFTKPAGFGLGQGSGVAIGGTGLFGGSQGTGFGTSSNMFGGATTTGGSGTSMFGTAFGANTGQGNSTNSFGSQNAFGFNSSAAPTTNAFGISTGTSTASGLNAFGTQSGNSGGFGMFGNAAATAQPTSGFGMFSGGGAGAGFGQFGSQQNQTGIGAGIFGKPQGISQPSQWIPQQPVQALGQYTPQQPQYPAYGNPVVQSNLNNLGAAAAAVTGSAASKAPYALVYLPIETLSLKKDDPAKNSQVQASKKNTEAPTVSHHVTEDDSRFTRHSNYYSPLPIAPQKKAPLLGENPLAKLETRYGHVMAKKGEPARSFVMSPIASNNPRSVIGVEKIQENARTKSTKQFASPASPVVQSSFLTDYQQYPKASPYFSSVSTKASPSFEPTSFLEVELASGRTILLPVHSHDLLANAMKTLLDKQVISSNINSEDMAFFKGHEKLQLTMLIEELDLQPGERIYLKQLKKTKKPQLASAGLVPSIGPTYSCSPSIADMALFSEEELQEVQAFAIWNEWGRIQFLCPVDLRGLRLEHLIKIEKRLVEIYPDDLNKPPRGEGLNMPTRIEFYHFGLVYDPSDRQGTQKMQQRIRSWAAKNQATLLSIDYQEDTVVIQTTGLPESPEEGLSPN